MKEVTLKIVKNDPTQLILQNENGDYFLFNQNSKSGKEMYDFLNTKK